MEELAASNITLLEPQSRFGDKPVKFQVVCPQNGTAVQQGMNYQTQRSTLRCTVLVYTVVLGRYTAAAKQQRGKCRKAVSTKNALKRFRQNGAGAYTHSYQHHEANINTASTSACGELTRSHIPGTYVPAVRHIFSWWRWYGTGAGQHYDTATTGSR